MAPVHEPQIRPLTLEELALVLDWAGREGWNPGLRDAPAFYAADPQGFLGAFVEGRLVGSISMVVYDDSYAFAGLYMVEPDLRAQGLGLALGRAAQARVGRQVVGLDGVKAMQESYRALGFSMAFTGMRCQGQGGGPDPGGVRTLSVDDLPRVEALDRRCFPGPRSEFLRRWLAYPGGAALGLEQGDALAGYGVIRPCALGYRIGPLFAPDPTSARRLYRALCSRVAQGAPVFLDVPQNNPQAVTMARELGLTPGFQCGRMYMNGEPPWAAHMVYGITTFELG